MHFSHSHPFVDWLIDTDFLIPIFVLVALAGFYFSTIIRNPYTVLYPLAILTGAFTFVILRNRHPTQTVATSANLYKLSAILFFVVLTSLLSIYHAEGLWRSDTIFHLTFLLYGLVGLTILTKPNPIIGLSLITLVGLFTRLTAYYASERYAGVDIYGHVELINGIVTAGSLEPFSASKYFYAPFYHIQAAQGQILFDVSTKDALALTTMVGITILPILVVYLVTCRFWSTRIGLIAALLYVGSDHVIARSVHLIPNSLGVTLFALVLLSMIAYYLQSDIRWFVIFVFGFAALSLTHQVSMFIAAVFATVVAASLCIYHFRIIPSAVHTIIAVGTITFLDFTVTQYSGPDGDISFFDQVAGGLFTSLLESGPETRAEVAFPDIAGYSPGGAAAMADIQLVGSALLLLFAILGVLYWFQITQDDQHRFVGFGLGISVFLMMVVALAGPIIGLRNLLPSRWWPFIYMIFAIFAGPGLVLTVRSIRDLLGLQPGRDILLVALVILVFSGFMVGSATASTDNPYLDQGFSAERYSITEQEVAIADHVSQTRDPDIEIYTDRRFSSNIQREFVTSRTIVVNYNDPDSIVSGEPKYIINRQYLSQTPANIVLQVDGNQWHAHGGFQLTQIHPSGYMTIYDNGPDEFTLLEHR